MNERQKKLVDYLLEKETAHLIDIRKDLGYKITSESLHNCTGRRLISRDIQEINREIENGILILSTDKGITITKDKEVIGAKLEREKVQILKKLKRLYIKQQKLGLDNQMSFVDYIYNINGGTNE